MERNFLYKLIKEKVESLHNQIFIGYIPYAVLYGHLHTCALDEVNGVKMIRGGSLAGCGDQHTVEKRLTGKPSQMVCICTDKGVQAFYPIELK